MLFTKKTISDKIGDALGVFLKAKTDLKAVLIECNAEAKTQQEIANIADEKRITALDQGTKISTIVIKLEELIG